MTSPFESPGSSPQMWKTSSPDIIWPECILGLAPPKTIVIEVNFSHKTVLFMWWWCLSHVTKMLSDYSLTLVFFLHLVSSSCWDYNTTSWLSYKNTSVNTAHINSSSTWFCCPLKFRGYLWILHLTNHSFKYNVCFSIRITRTVAHPHETWVCAADIIIF